MSRSSSDPWEEVLRVSSLIRHRPYLIISNQSFRRNAAEKIIRAFQLNAEEVKENFSRYGFDEKLVKFLEYCKEAGDNDTFNRVLDAFLKIYVKRGFEELRRDGFVLAEAKGSEDFFYRYALCKTYEEGSLVTVFHKFGIETFFIFPAVHVDDIFNILESDIFPGPSGICRQSRDFFVCDLEGFRSPDELVSEARKIREEFEHEKREMLASLDAMSKQLKSLGYDVHVNLKNLLDGTVEVKIHNVKTDGIARIFLKDNLDIIHDNMQSPQKFPNYKVIREAARIVKDTFTRGGSLPRHDINYFTARLIWFAPMVSTRHGWRRYLSLVKACIDSGFSVDGNVVSYNDDAFRKFITTYSPAMGVLERRLLDALWKINGCKTINKRRKLRAELAYRPAIAEQLDKTLKACYILTCKSSLDREDIDLVRECLSKGDEKNRLLLYHAIMVRLSEGSNKELFSAFEDFLSKEADKSVKYEVLSTIYDKGVPESSQAYAIAKKLAAELFDVDPSKVFLKTPISPNGVLLIDIGDQAKVHVLPIRGRFVARLILLDNIFQPYSNIEYETEAEDREFIFAATGKLGEEFLEWFQKIKSIFHGYIEAAEIVKNKAVKMIGKPAFILAYFSNTSGKPPIRINLPYLIIDVAGDNLSPEDAEKTIAELEKHCYVEVHGKKISLERLEEMIVKGRRKITV